MVTLRALEQVPAGKCSLFPVSGLKGRNTGFERSILQALRGKLEGQSASLPKGLKCYEVEDNSWFGYLFGGNKDSFFADFEVGGEKLSAFYDKASKVVSVSS